VEEVGSDSATRNHPSRGSSPFREAGWTQHSPFWVWHPRPVPFVGLWHAGLCEQDGCQQDLAAKGNLSRGKRRNASS
jgi:hypothetical protein